MAGLISMSPININTSGGPEEGVSNGVDHDGMTKKELWTMLKALRDGDPAQYGRYEVEDLCAKTRTGAPLHFVLRATTRAVCQFRGFD
jgi:hypothetical protein